MSIRLRRKFEYKLIYYAPLLILTASFLLKLTMHTKFGADYRFDEIVVTTISKQKIPSLLNTIKAEPHPPGFYFILKLFPVENTYVTKTLLMSVSYLLVFISLLWGYKKGVISNYSLPLGIALFLCSFTFLEITSQVKQESISFPILLFHFFVILVLVQKRSKLQNGALILVNILTTTILLLGYIYYFAALLSLTIAVVVLRKYRLPAILLFFQIIILVFYFYLWGSKQLLLNTGRFTWLTDHYNSFVYALESHLVGNQPIGFVRDIVSLLFVTLIIFSYKWIYRKKGKEKVVYFSFILILAIILAFSYLVRVHTTIRFSSVSFFLMSIIAGWGLIYLSKVKKVVLLVLIIFFAASFSFFIKHDINIRILRNKIAYFLKQESQNDKFGFLDEHPMFPLVFKLVYKDQVNIVPLNAFFPNVFKNKDTIERQHLMLDGKTYSLTFLELKKLLGKNELTNFLYIFRIHEKTVYFDPERLTLRVLDSSCSDREIIPLDYRMLLFVFKNCAFE